MPSNSLQRKQPAETCTLSEFVASGINDDMTYRNFSIFGKIKDMEVLDHCLVDDYLDELKASSLKITGITDAERLRYRYSPDLLAYDMYGSTQLDFVIMAINGVVTPTEFTMQGNIYLPKKSVLKSILSMIYNAELEYIQINRTEYEIN